MVILAIIPGIVVTLKISTSLVDGQHYDSTLRILAFGSSIVIWNGISA
jgi:hypothetical protein